MYNNILSFKIKYLKFCDAIVMLIILINIKTLEAIIGKYGQVLASIGS